MAMPAQAITDTPELLTVDGSSAPPTPAAPSHPDQSYNPGMDVLDFAQRLSELRKEVRREEAAAAMARRIAKVEMKAAATTHRVGQVVVDVGDHEGQHRLSAAYALIYDGRDYSHTTVEEAEKLSVRELQAYLCFHKQELMKGWLKPKLKGLVMAHICNTRLLGHVGRGEVRMSKIGMNLNVKLEEGMEELSMKRHGHAKQLVVFFGAATIGTAGGWGADAVLRACRKVVCRPRGTDQRRGRVVLVDEHRTSRVSSAVNGQQPCEVELNTLSATRPAGWRPPAGQVEEHLVRPAWSQERGQPVRGLVWCPVVAPRRPPQAPRSSQAATQAAASEPGPSTPQPAKRSKRTKAEPGAAEPTKGKAQGKAAKAKPAPQPGRWLDRDCNAALNMQRIGESRWRPLELCFWPDQGALPAKGKEYPGLGYKRLRDKPPKAQEQQQQPAEAQ
ncbi:hypothetical protein QJQ45_003314 [Haematococcus lacustris]|nr:hypothetical protein QJQ45_003314 [Haematococcus lacustris]